MICCMMFLSTINICEQGPELIRVNAKWSTLIDILEVECKTVHELFMMGVEQSGTMLHISSPYSVLFLNVFHISEAFVI